MSLAFLDDPAREGDAPIAGTPRLDEFDRQGIRGRWPRMINLDDETEDRLTRWLEDELDRHFVERQDLLDQWEKHQEQYWAEPEQEVKNFPFTRAANIVIPLTAIAVEAVHARIMNTLFSVEPFWSIRPRSKSWIPAAKPMEQYLQAESETSLDTYEFCNETTLDIIKLGVGIGKSGYKRDVRKSLRTFPDAEEEPIYVETHNGATLDRVPPQNFLMRLGDTDPQEAAWVGEYHTVTWGKLKRHAQSGRMIPEGVEAIKDRWVETRSDSETGDPKQVTRKVEELANAEPQWFEEFRFQEIWCSFDVDGDGWDEEIVIDFHKESGTILSIRYNWYEDLHRPYRIAQYVKVEGIWPGIGVGKQNEQFQEEVTTIHRQRLDNATLANMAQIVIKKNSGYGPGEPIFPGKMWFVDDPRNDIKEFKLSEVYSSSFVNEEAVVQYYEKRTGVNEVVLGLPQQGTPGTATGDLARLAEGNKRFDLVLKNIKKWGSKLGQDVIANYQQFGNRQVHWLILEEDGQWVEQVLNMPAELVRRGAIIDLSVTDSITNRDVEQRQWLQLFQVVTNYYERVINLASILQNPQILAQVAQRAVQASDEALRRMLETFDIPDSDRFALTQEAGQDARGTDVSGRPSGPSEGPARGSEAVGSRPGLAGVQTPRGSNGGGPATGGQGVI